VFNVAVQQQTQRVRGSPCAQVERERVHIGVAVVAEIGEVVDVAMVLLCEQWQDAAAIVVPRASEQVRRGRNENSLAGGEWALAEETLVGEDLRVVGVIDGDETKLVDVVNLFHGLAKAQAV